MKCYTQHNPKPSKFEPYISEIANYIIDGLTITEVAEKLDMYFPDIVDSGALYSFIRSRGLDLLKDQKNVPECNSCDGCREIIDTDEKPIRTCYSARIIPNNIKTSPYWCHKRKKAERVS